MISKEVKRLIKYATYHLGLDEEDAIYCTNLLFRELGVTEPFDGEVDDDYLKSLSVPDELTTAFKDYFVNELKMNERDAVLKVGYIMGVVSPRPSKVNETFYSLLKESPKKATDYLLDLSIKNDYVQKTKVDKNIVWDASFNDGPSIEVSINLSKPEKNNKDIAKLVNSVSSSYPKCLLCHENLGFEGNTKKDPRETIRMIPLNLGGEKWYMQYSPYGYFDEHCILLYEKHEPMTVNKRIISREFDFVDQFPHYFVGSNSDLPIVGGSILDHEHFQGGLHLMPVMKAPDKEVFPTNKYKDVTLSLLDFYNTTLCLKGSNRESVINLANDILVAWRDYSDPENDIVAKDENGLHNTITTMVRKENGNYLCYMILRNNRCDETYPDGIFHAHPEYHMIKKEGIGLIEAAGLFILPPRLPRQFAQIEDIIKRNLDRKSYLEIYPDMADFGDMIEEIRSTGISTKQYVNNVCKGILNNVGVFKNNEIGKAGLHKFLKGINL